MTGKLSRKVAIVGMGEILPSMASGLSQREANVEACRLALEDAGLTFKDIDGLITPELRLGSYDVRAPMLAEYLGITPSLMITQAWGGSTMLTTVLEAAAYIASGLANTILVTNADVIKSSSGSTSGFMEMGAHTGGRQPNFEWPYGAHTVSMFALMAQRHMYEYGTTSEQLASIAVAFRKHAMRHPRALMRTPITIQDVLDSKMVASPLHKLDCCIISDGGAAFVLTSAQRARDMKQKPVYLLGGANGRTHMHLSYAPSLTTFGSALAAPVAFKMAGIEPKDIDVLFVYDSFTINALIQLEDLGFCKKGEGGAFVEGDRLSLGGELPTNTHGGLLSYSHPGRPGHFSHLAELVLQLRGQAEERQVKGARLSLINSQGGPNSVLSTLIFGN